MNNLQRSEQYPLRRRTVVKQLLDAMPEALVITGLGATAWDVTAAGDSPRQFPLWGAMGGAAMIGLGLALAQPQRRVLVITGDGELLMGLGGLATIAVQSPANLVLAVIDNERYGETGMQLTHSAYGVDFAAIARGAGFERCFSIADDTDWATHLPTLASADGPLLATIKVRAEVLPLVLPPKDGVTLKDRFRAAILPAET